MIINLEVDNVISNPRNITLPLLTMLIIPDISIFEIFDCSIEQLNNIEQF